MKIVVTILNMEQAKSVSEFNFKNNVAERKQKFNLYLLVSGEQWKAVERSAAKQKEIIVNQSNSVDIVKGHIVMKHETKKISNSQPTIRIKRKLTSHVGELVENTARINIRHSSECVGNAIILDTTKCARCVDL